jgi:thiol-disulfide isomerase/thioredoxin
MVPLLHRLQALTNTAFITVVYCVACTLLYAKTAYADNELAQAPPQPTSPWFERDKNHQINVDLYFFWSKKCPHCREAVPFIHSLPQEHPWLKLHSLELTEHPEHVRQYITMAKKLGQEARSVPAFLWCGQMTVGYDNDQGMGRYLLLQLQQCKQQIETSRVLNALKRPGDTAALVSLPLLGQLDLNSFSLPAYTVILAGLDAFNPCAFFVLLFLLSLLVHAKNRSRMLFIGGIFVVFSGLLYFLFMAAWLNVFLLMGQINIITYIAGAVAVLIAALNIKDYFWFKQGVSLSIPDSAKPGLFSRMRKIANTDNSFTMVLAAMGLAAFANIYEFLCTAGFPMVFTRILTLHQLSAGTYYWYLAFYNLIYVVPLSIIVFLFAYTLGAKKLSEQQGKVLKLLSGIMMLCLGLTLLLTPNWLNNAGIAVLLLLVSLLCTFFVVRTERYFSHNPAK